MLGTYALSSGYYDAYYKKAQQVRTKIREELDSELDKVDIILTPTSYSVAFEIGKKVDDPLAMYQEDMYVTGPSLAGLPALSVPAGFIDGLPMGMQLITKKKGELRLFEVASVWEKNTKVLDNKPKL
jgi:aspartyl-tRNA(Asn)/glutamyl-tRNA(Gln) amidotransferase subunit A